MHHDKTKLMKFYHNLFVFLTLCFSANSLSATEEFSSEIHATILEGDTTIMQEQGTQILTDCAGVILDPGGYGDYQNGINSVITIQPPSSTSITLFFPLFHIENTFDDFLIYDGADQNAPLIGLYDNMDLQDQTIVSTGGALTIVFITDNSVVREGFFIDYLVAGGSETPVANFEVSQTSPIPLNFPVSFTDISENAGTWLYDFGDGHQSIEQNPTHAYTESGSFEVTLTVSNCGNTDTFTQIVYVQESGQLQINPDEICATLNSFQTTTLQVTLTNTGLGDLYYNFTEISNENPNSLTVILGTGIIPPGGSQIVNLFFSAGELFGGTYNHDLLLQTGDASQLEIVYPVKMIVIGIPLISVAPNSITNFGGLLGNPIMDSVCVTNLGTDTLHISDIAVDTPGYLISPTELSVAPGGEEKFTITLLADEVGVFAGNVSIFSNANTVVTIPVLTEVIDPPVGVFNPDNICLNLAQNESTLLLMGVSNQGGNALDWDFAFTNTIPDWLEIGTLSGSLVSGESESVPIIINSTGLISGEYEYNATIFTNDPILGDAHLNIKLTVIAPPIANFFTFTQNSCDGIISFSDLSEGEVTSWLWNFGDNTFSEEQNPTHIYEETGVYDVSLIACNPAGCDTLLLENLVNYSNDQSLCDTLFFGITGDTTLLSCNGYIYDSGGIDGDYAENSNYAVTINPPNALAISLTFDTFDLENNWDFLNIYAGIDNTAPLLGTFTGIEAPGGGSLAVFGEAVTLELISDGIIERAGFAIAYACITPAAEANFTANISEECSNDILFTNNSLYGATYSWDFGDGNFSDETSPTHTYNSTGIFNVILTAENDFGTSTFTETVVISELPFELNIVSPTNIYINNPTELSYNSSNNLSNVEWSTESGDISNLDNPIFAFSQIGNTEITLIGTDTNGCQVVVNEIIFVDELSHNIDDNSISSLKVFPVPTNKSVNIELKIEENSNVQLSLFNATGQQIFKNEFQTVFSLNEELDLTNYPSGIYHLGIWINGQFAGRKRIILID